MARWLALDLGKRFWGIAIAHDERGFVQPLGVLPAEDRQRNLRKIHEWLKEYAIEVIAVGIPLKRGRWSRSTEQIYTILRWIQKRIIGVHWVIIDEVGSTMEAKSGFRERSDDLAAVIILQRALFEENRRIDSSTLKRLRQVYLAVSNPKRKG